MKENRYDDESFFQKYAEMMRSQQGLAGAGEWPELKKLLPDFRGKRVLDLGCGYGWHCKYAAEQGAQYVLGTDISHKMLESARRKNADSHIEYRCIAMEDAAFPPGSFDVILSSLAFHSAGAYKPICKPDSHASGLAQCRCIGTKYQFLAGFAGCLKRPTAHPAIKSIKKAPRRCSAYRGPIHKYHHHNGSLCAFILPQRASRCKKEAFQLWQGIRKETMGGMLASLR